MKKVFVVFLLLNSILMSYTCCSGQQIGWQWAKRTETDGISEGEATATDQNGNVFVTGAYYSPSVTFNTTTLTSVGVALFIVKYDSLGNLLWAKSFSGARGYGIACDPSGNVFVTGSFSEPSVVFDNTTLQKSDYDNPGSTAEFFIAKLDPDGNAIWAKSAQGSMWDEGDDIEIDAFGNIYVSGIAGGPILFDSMLLLDGMGYFLAKFDETGKIIWVNRSGSSLSESYGHNNISLDLRGNIYFTGGHLINLPDNYPSIQAFLTKFNSEGTVLWTKDFVGDGYRPFSSGTSVTTDATGSVYISGYYHHGISFNGVKLFSTGSFGYYPSIFIVKFDAAGNTLWVESATKGRGIAMGIASHKSGGVFVTGALELFGLNRDTLNFGNIYLHSSIQNTGRGNTFVAQYNSEGKALWAYLVESETGNDAFGISTDPFGNVIITGRLNSNGNIPYEPAMGPIKLDDITLQQSNNMSMFVAKLKPCQPPVEVIKLPLTICEGTSIVLTSDSTSNNLWSTGSIEQSISVSKAGSYQLIVSDVDRCNLSVITTEVKVNPLPNVSIIANSEFLCANNSVVIAASEGKSFLWNNGEITQNITVINPGNYMVTVTDENGCKATSDIIQIKMNPPTPEIKLFSDCNRIFFIDNYPATWFKNDMVINEVTPNQKEIIPLDSGYFYVETSDLCSSQRSNGIHFKPAEIKFIFQPNVITPNGDEYNEFFVLDEKLSGSSLLIINRWGNEVFSSSNYLNTWNGGDLAVGVYYYIINNTCFEEPIKGTLSILR